MAHLADKRSVSSLFSIHTTTSNDGTLIGFRQTGSGAGLIVCHGAGRISQNYEKLAGALADKFTVYIPDRRGRGLSGEEGGRYDINKAVEDLIAVIKATGADFIFGHSTGGLIALETMITHPVKKLAVYEPPVSIDHSFPLSWLPDFENALREGRKKEAMAISLKGLNAVKGMEKLPLWIVKLFVSLLTLLERKKEKGTRMLDLIATLTADVSMVLAHDSSFEGFKDISIPVSLSEGTESPEYFHTGLSALSDMLRYAHIKTFSGFDHYSPEEKVKELSDYLKDFFTGNQF